MGSTWLVAPPYRRLHEAAVDVVVLRCENPSVSFPELLETMGEMSAPVIVLSPRADTETVVEVFRSGMGYMVEDDFGVRVLSSAVMAAMMGNTYVSPVACAVLREAAWRGRVAGDAAERLRELLSPRERQIMELLSTGLSAQEISLRLRLAEKTVRNNLSSIYAKLGARGSTEAVLRWLGTAPAVRA
ncbi:response regulator transcription factor [Streptomyces sp. NPDC001027]|uniref:response regulator transcription factor n=1 Tax=Streptomyces sp. NPDC001027 TaxID=3154771 RepID=UPI00331D48B4